MEKPEILCSVNAAWCAATVNAAFVMGGASAFGVGGAVVAAACNVPAVGALMVGGGAL